MNSAVVTIPVGIAYLSTSKLHNMYHCSQRICTCRCIGICITCVCMSARMDTFFSLVSCKVAYQNAIANSRSKKVGYKKKVRQARLL